jgi:MoaA/NifB/PqqE/SkfB family radical SAM enzyme
MPREMTRGEIFGAPAEFDHLGMRDTHLDGGEPLTHPHIGEIVDWLVERRIPVSMNTNGILVLRRLNIIRKLSGVTISLDGPRDNHDALRGAGSHDRAIAAATASRDAGVHVEFTCTVGRHNVDAIDDVVEIARLCSPTRDGASVRAPLPDGRAGAGTGPPARSPPRSAPGYGAGWRTTALAPGRAPGW